MNCKTYENLEIKRDEFGHVDQRFYHNRALQMRDEALRELGSHLAESVSKVLHVLCDKLFCPGRSTAH